MLLVLVALACGPRPSGDVSAAAPSPSAAGAVGIVHLDDPPAAPGALAPYLATAGDGLLATWLEPAGEGAHRLLAARRDAGSWGGPVVVAQGPDLFANWADVPVAAEAPDGSLWVAWPSRIGSDTYAYSPFLARSTDGGRTWAPAGALPDDASPAEHGFPAFARDGDHLVAVWLDGREMLTEGPMTLRARTLSSDEPGAEEVLDERVCDCCPVSAAATRSGPVVAYRNRSDEEVRDPWSVRRTAGGWSRPQAIAEDAWEIAGCPVNGPALAASGDTVVAVWFTGAGGAPAVEGAFSSDGGATWGERRSVDGAGPVGRVGVALARDGSARVSWLGGARGEEAELRVARLSPSGVVGRPLAVGRTAAGRPSGVPRLVLRGETLSLLWREVRSDAPPRLRFAEVLDSAIPGP